MRDLAEHESGQLIDLAAPGPDGAALIRTLLAEREQTGRMRRGILRCASHGAPMYLQWRAGHLYACHWPGVGAGDHHVALMSKEHRLQTEYVARAADRAGLSTAFEVALPSRVRPDLVIGEATAVEVQRSHLTVQQARSRTTKAIKGGMALSLWLSDKEPRYAPQWMFKVPSATAFARSWLTMPPMGSATVTSGVRELVPEQCRPPVRTHCAERGGRWCGKWHLTHRPLIGVSLDDLAVGVANGTFVPAVVRGHVILARMSEVQRYDVAWTPPGQLSASASVHEAQRMICQARDRRPIDEVMCCGQKPPCQENTGQPLLQACQLCPDSPTYWRLPANRADGRPYKSADLYDVEAN